MNKHDGVHSGAEGYESEIAGLRQQLAAVVDAQRCTPLEHGEQPPLNWPRTTADMLAEQEAGG